MDPGTPLPAGTITFLFTDIEGSTRLWEHHSETMRAALARHDALLTAFRISPSQSASSSSPIPICPPTFRPSDPRKHGAFLMK